jgi:hypothetical protein
LLFETILAVPFIIRFAIQADALVMSDMGAGLAAHEVALVAADMAFIVPLVLLALLLLVEALL